MLTQYAMSKAVPCRKVPTMSQPSHPPLALSLGLTHRPRRNRKADWSRRLVRENVLTADDLIWPIFLVEGENRPHARHIDAGRRAVLASIRRFWRRNRPSSSASRPSPCFPSPIRPCATPTAREALNDANLVCRACRAIKQAVPQIGVITDVALDPYTSHGHDGVMHGDAILNDETVAILVEQALNQARAGADVIAPSDMMDGRVGAIRAGLDAKAFSTCRSWPMRRNMPRPSTARSATPSAPARRLIGDKRTYQMDPANSDEALREVALDHRGRRRHDDGQARPALSRYYPRVKDAFRRADLRLSSFGGICDDHGRGAKWLARRRPGDVGKPPRLQTGGRQRRADLFCAKSGGNTEKGR